MARPPCMNGRGRRHHSTGWAGWHGGRRHRGRASVILFTVAALKPPARTRRQGRYAWCMPAAPPKSSSLRTTAAGAAPVGAGSPVAPQDPALLRRLLRAKDRMDAASHEAWPVPRLAEVSGVSEAHFARSFRQAFGIPPHRYLLTRRIEQASTLLRDTDLPITEIALPPAGRAWAPLGAPFATSPGKVPRTCGARPRPTPRPWTRCPPAC